MGWPMVLRLHDAGHDVTVLCRTDDAVARARNAGVRPAHGLAETAAGAELTTVCVFTDEQVGEVCLGAGGLVESADPGACLVIHTTGDPRTAERVAAAAGERGVSVLDAPVSGGPQNIEAGAITLYVGGAARSLDAARPALAAYGSPIIHAGPLGHGQRVKLVNNVLFAANLELVADACAWASTSVSRPTWSFADWSTAAVDDRPRPWSPLRAPWSSSTGRSVSSSTRTSASPSRSPNRSGPDSVWSAACSAPVQRSGDVVDTSF